MRELEFLPAWYSQTRRRKRMVILQAWMTVTLAAGLGLFMFLSQRNVRAAENELSLIQTDLTQTDSELKKLDELLTLKNQLQQQQQILDKLGTYVEVTRMLGKIDSIMPNEMALVGLSLKTVEMLEPINGLSKSAAVKKGEQKVSRRLEVSVQGVAPTHVDVANFVMQLSSLPYFEKVFLVYGRDKSESGHIMREFEISFYVNLNAAGAGAAGGAVASAGDDTGT